MPIFNALTALLYCKSWWKLSPLRYVILFYSWENEEGVKILDGSNIYVEGTTLILETLRADHSGVYTCVAENMAGSRSLSLEIQVTGKFTVCLV